jgi:uncharacterized protein YbjT (DUF2867 family)
MSTERGTILVAGATGTQGGAVIRHLIDAGFSVRGVTRDPDKPRAQELRGAGVDIVRGDLTDPASLDGLFEGVSGVFSMATPFEAGMDAEVVQGRNLGDAAKAAGVRHYVYSSVGGAERDSGVPHFETKWAVEQHLRELGLPLTVVRPVYFFENFAGWSLRPAEDGYAIMMPLSPDRTLQGVAADDIGAFVALAFSAPDEWVGRAFELAGDERTVPQYAEAIATRIGKPVQYVRIPWEAVQSQNEDLYRMLRFFEERGYEADIPALRRAFPELHDFGSWLAAGGIDGFAGG